MTPRDSTIGIVLVAQVAFFASFLRRLFRLSVRSEKKISRPVRGGFRENADVGGVAYFSWVETVLNVPLRVVPTEFTEAMITIDIPAAIRPYSIAVAPDSSFRNANNVDM